MDRPTPTMTRHIGALWPRERETRLFEDAEAVERMLGSPAWGAVVAVIEREVATIDRELDGGAAKDAAEYAKAHGRRGALRAAEDAARAILEVAARQRERAEAEARAHDAAAESVAERIV